MIPSLLLWLKKQQNSFLKELILILTRKLLLLLQVFFFSLSHLIIILLETAPIAIAHVLRSKYHLSVQNIGKKKRPHMGPETLREDYSAGTFQSPIFSLKFNSTFSLTFSYGS